MTKRILITGLIAGTMDALGATIHFLIAGGKNPVRIFNYVASGVFGSDALSGGIPMALMGLIFHYMIATLWTFIFFKLYPAITTFTNNWVILGVAYGLFVWAGMNLIVVPLSNTPPPLTPMSLNKVATAAFVLIICIGLPISYQARRFFIAR